MKLNMIKQLKKSRVKNNLALIPIKSHNRVWESWNNGLIEIILPRNGLVDRLIRLIKDTPKVMRIQLDDLGSYVWQNIDGSRTIEEIGCLLNAEFGKELSLFI